MFYPKNSKERKTIERWQNRIINQQKGKKYFLDINRSVWKRLFKLEDKVLGEFAKTHYTTEEIDNILTEYFKIEDSKHKISELKRYWTNSKKFVEYEYYFDTLSNVRFRGSIRMYRTGEVYIWYERPCVPYFLMTSIEDLKEFSLIDYLKENNPDDFVLTEYEKLCKFVFSNEELFPRHQWGINTKAHQKDYLKDGITVFLTKHLRNKQRSPRTYNSFFEGFRRDNKPCIASAIKYVEQYLNETKITPNDIINDYLIFRNYLFKKKMRTDSYKKKFIDYPCLDKGLFGEYTKEETVIVNSLHDKYKYDPDCVFDRLYLNEEELKEAKEIMCMSYSI